MVSFHYVALMVHGFFSKTLVFLWLLLLLLLSHFNCVTLCDPIDGSSSGSPVPGILQARTLEWVAISFSNAWKWKVKVKLLSHVWLSDPMDCSPPGSSAHGIFQARVLEWIAIVFSMLLWHIFVKLHDIHQAVVQSIMSGFISLVFYYSPLSWTVFLKLLLFRWSNRCWQFGLWFLCLF